MNDRIISCFCEKTIHDLHMLEPIPGTDLFTVMHRDGTKLSRQDGSVIRLPFNKANMWAKALDND